MFRGRVERGGRWRAGWKLGRRTRQLRCFGFSLIESFRFSFPVSPGMGRADGSADMPAGGGSPPVGQVPPPGQAQASIEVQNLLCRPAFELSPAGAASPGTGTRGEGPWLSFRWRRWVRQVSLGPKYFSSLWRERPGLAMVSDRQAQPRGDSAQPRVWRESSPDPGPMPTGAALAGLVGSLPAL